MSLFASQTVTFFSNYETCLDLKAWPIGAPCVAGGVESARPVLFSFLPSSSLSRLVSPYSFCFIGRRATIFFTGYSKRIGAKFRELSSNFLKLADWLCMGWPICLAAKFFGIIFGMILKVHFCPIELRMSRQYWKSPFFTV